VTVNAGERAARERIEDVFTAVDRLSPEALSWPSVPDRDLVERTVLLAELEREADRSGRGALLDEAREQLRDTVRRRIVARHYPEAGVAGVSFLGRPEDAAGVALALEDAVSVAVAEDLLHPDDAAALADPGRRLLRMEPLPGSSLGPVPAAPSWEPSPADWTAATGDGPAAVDAEEPMRGSRRIQAIFFGLVGGFGVLMALAVGLSYDEWLLAIAAAAAIAVLAWTFATYRRPINRP
jgi:hypothetical protein